MRINEKSLSKFASSGAPADKEGSLLKKGELNKGYQKRWFVLKGNLLFYYEKRMDKEPLGVIVCEGCTIELSENTDGFAFQIVFPKSGCRTYHMAADSQEEMEAWMKVLSCASYNYMRLMVSELKQQLEEIQENSKAMLVETAMRDSHMISNRYSSLSPKNSQSDEIVDHRRARINPFNDSSTELLPPSSEAFDNKSSMSENLIDIEPATVRTKHKSFLDMHMEYGREVKTLSEMWRESFNARPASAFELHS